MSAPYLSNTIQSNRGVFNPGIELNTVEPCLEDATDLICQLRGRLAKPGNKRLLRAFTALADGDPAIGMLAFYLWRRRARRQT